MSMSLLDNARVATIAEAIAAGSNQTRLTSETLPPAAYSSQAFFELEAEAIFRSDWVCVGHVSAVPDVGDYLSVDIVGEPLVIVRGEDRIRVLSRVCRHRWAPVVSGRGTTKLFSCPFHKWTYGLDGELLAAPFMEGSEPFDKSKCPLPEVKTEIVEDLGLIFVTLSEPVDSIGDRLAEFRRRFASWRMGELATVRTLDMDSAFNWKIQSETFMECYHHIGAHSETFEYDQPARLSSCEDGRAGWSLCLSPFRGDTPSEFRSFGFPPFDLDEGERGGVHYVNIFPNALLAIRPDNIGLVTVFPEGPSRTRAHRITLARPEALLDPTAVERALANRNNFANLVAGEDNDVNELQQLGAGSRLARPGRLSQLETTVWDLANYVRRRVALSSDAGSL